MKTVIFPKWINWLFGRISPFILFLRVFDVKPTKCNPSPKSANSYYILCQLLHMWMVGDYQNFEFVCTSFRREISLLLFQSHSPSVFQPTLHICIISTSSIWCLNTRKPFSRRKNALFLAPFEYISETDLSEKQQSIAYDYKPLHLPSIFARKCEMIFTP